MITFIINNLKGEIVKVNVDEFYHCDSRRIISLYEAVAKFSTEESPDITDPASFYIEVDKNISSGTLIDSKSAFSSIHALQKLKNLYDIFTAPNSDKGYTVTVKEYSEMFDSWSSCANK